MPSPDQDTSGASRAAPSGDGSSGPRRIGVVGLNHRTAPVHVREQASLPDDLALRLCALALERGIAEEAAVLDTCNRTELYFVAPEEADAAAGLLACVRELKGACPGLDDSTFRRWDGQEAVRHLFRVAGSLDSQLVGEDEILGQVKHAYELACRAGSSGFLLNKLFQWAFRAGKRVRTETRLGAGSASIAQAAVELSGRIFSSLEGRRVLLVGAGQAGRVAARALARAGVSEIVVANRTRGRAGLLAAELASASPKGGSAFGCADGEERPFWVCPALLEFAPDCALARMREAAGRPAPRIEAIGLGRVPEAIAEVDVVICSTGSRRPVLTRERLAGPIGRRERPLLIVDIAVPRDADPRLAELPQVALHNIDALDRMVEENLRSRRREIPRAEAILEGEVERFMAWRGSLQVVPTIKLLKAHFRALCEAELQGRAVELDPERRRQLERFAAGLSGKVLHGPFRFLNRLARDGSDGEVMAAVELIRGMFGLDGADGSPHRSPETADEEHAKAR